MARFIALKPCIVNNCFKEVGDEFDHEGDYSDTVMVPLESLEPVKKPRKRRVQTPRPPEVPTPGTPS